MTLITNHISKKLKRTYSFRHRITIGEELKRKEETLNLISSSSISIFFSHAIQLQALKATWLGFISGGP